MFLHPVNVRCLVREYGSLEQSPEKISATVVEIVGYSMSEVRPFFGDRGLGSNINLMSLGWAQPAQVHRPSRPLVFLFLRLFLLVMVPVNFLKVKSGYLTVSGLCWSPLLFHKLLFTVVWEYRCLLLSFKMNLFCFSFSLLLGRNVQENEKSLEASSQFT